MSETILSYFGTFTPAAEGPATFQFEYLTSLGFAAIVIFLGRFIVARSATLRKFAIPAPVVSGLLFSVVIALLKGTGIIGLSFETSTLKTFAKIFSSCAWALALASKC